MIEEKSPEPIASDALKPSLLSWIILIIVVLTMIGALLWWQRQKTEQEMLGPSIGIMNSGQN